MLTTKIRINNRYPLVLIFSFVFTVLGFAQVDINKPLSKFTLESDNDFWYSGEEARPINMVAYFKALTNVNEEHERYPLNLSIVIDRSGSMAGDKLEKTKEAVVHLLKQLQETDIVSVVTYETNVEVVISPQKVTDVKDMIKKVEKIESDGSTFLSGGMEKGYKLIQSKKKSLEADNYVNRMILLSDGLANEGIIDPQALTAIARKQATDNNITISTIGVGGDYNEELMTEIAVQGNGNYYFVSGAGDIPEIFRTELQGMQSVLAKNTLLTVTFPESVSLRQVYLYNYALKDNTVTIELNDVFSDDEKAFIMEFDVADGYNGEIEFQASLSYLNALNELSEVSETKSFALKETSSENEFDDSFRQFGSLAQAFMISTHKFELATKAADEGKFNEAESLLETATTAIKDYEGNFKSHPFLEDIEDGIKEYEKELKEMQKKPSRRRNLHSRGRRHGIYRWKTKAKF